MRSFPTPLCVRTNMRERISHNTAQKQSFPALTVAIKTFARGAHRRDASPVCFLHLNIKSISSIRILTKTITLGSLLTPADDPRDAHPSDSSRGDYSPNFCKDFLFSKILPRILGRTAWSAQDTQTADTRAGGRRKPDGQTVWEASQGMPKKNISEQLLGQAGF